MHYFVILILSVFTFTQLSAQNLQVRVVDIKGETLPYAGVYINQIQCCVTDSDGNAIISFNKLKEGDTITSTYIGMNTSSIIFNKALRDLSKCTIVLKNDRVYELDPVVIKAIANDDWKFFHKNAKTYSSIFYQSCIVKGNFKANLLLSQDKKIHNVEGSFGLKNDMPSKVPSVDFYKYYFTETPVIETSVQDTAVMRRVESAIKRCINTTCQLILRINWEHFNNSKYSKVKYLGLNGNCNYFRIVYTNHEYKDSLSFQTLFTVNKDNHEIEKIEFYTPLKVHSGSIDRDKLITAGCTKIVYNKGKREATLTVPREITYNNRVIDNSTISLNLTEITFRIINK